MPQRLCDHAIERVNGLPAIITHHIFGEDAASLLPDGLLTSQEDLLAFLLGNQGTDPFWARMLSTPKVVGNCHEFATRTHASNMVQALMSLRKSVSQLRDDDMSCGRAFVLGMSAHYVLDSLTHPLVYAQQEAIVAADPSLAIAQDEIHALIESDIDVWMLWEKRQQTILDLSCASVLASTKRIKYIAGALLSQMAWEVYGLNVGAAEYGQAVRDYQLLYRAIDPPNSGKLRALAKIERLGRPYSRLQAQAHRVTQSDECPFANLDHRLWKDPVTGEASIASFADLFHDALLAWQEFSRRIVAGDPKRLDDMIAGINYNGQPV